MITTDFCPQNANMASRNARFIPPTRNTPNMTPDDPDTLSGEGHWSMIS